MIRSKLLPTAFLLSLSLPLAAQQVTGTVTEWYGGAPGRSPSQRGLNGASVVAGPNLDLDIGQAGFDTVRGNVVARGGTNERGGYSLSLPPGNYVIIFWKEGYTPQVESVTSPASLDASINRDTSMQQLHKALKFGNP